MRAVSNALFAAVARGDDEITTHDSVLGEVFYVLCSPRQYDLTHEVAVEKFLPIVELEGFRLGRKQMYVDAMGLFAENPALDFTDCLLAIYAEDDGHDLLTYDGRLAQEAGVEVYSG